MQRFGLVPSGLIQSAGQIFGWSAAVRGSPQAEGGGHVLSGFWLPTPCGWVFDHSRAPGRRVGSQPVPASPLRPELDWPYSGNQTHSYLWTAT